MQTLTAAPELARFHDEPPQMKSGAIGKNGLLRLGFERRGTRTALTTIDRRTPLLAQQALYYDTAMPDLPCVMTISTAGGMLQGDRSALEIALADDCEAHVTTQSANKIQQMDANFAAQTQDVVLGERAYLEFLPEATIPYRNARFVSRTRITLPSTATLLYAEILQAGRVHHGAGERFVFDLMSSTVSASRPDSTPLFCEKFVIDPARRDVRTAGVMGDYEVFANVLLLAPADAARRVFDATAAEFDRAAQCAAGASRLPHDAGLIYKVVGIDRESVQARVRAFWSSVRAATKGRPLAPPFLWR
jgi:urease accessory protein